MAANASPMRPEPAAADTGHASLLTQRYGEEVVNYYAGSRLNRFSFLRADNAFLCKAVTLSSTRFIALNALCTLIAGGAELALFTFHDVRPLIGPEPFRLSDADAIAAFDSADPRPLVVFLGALEEEHAPAIGTLSHGALKAELFFAIDATPRGPRKDLATTFIDRFAARGITIESNPRSMTLHARDASMFAQARTLIDWNARNPFCADCRLPNLSVEAGYKRVCPPSDRCRGAEPQVRGDCPTGHGISNICFPRSDPTMIAAVVSADGRRILLGRQARFPPGWYSALAGFLEPGESLEDAVRREVWEEAGVKVGRVVAHSTQPWPYPATLMLGAIAQALPGEETVTLQDQELEDAKWFPLDRVQSALDLDPIASDALSSDTCQAGELHLPPRQAIATQLLRAAIGLFRRNPPRI